MAESRSVDCGFHLTPLVNWAPDGDGGGRRLRPANFNEIAWHDVFSLGNLA